MKRRHVYRVAAAYVVVGWLLIQVATQVFPFFKIPDWAVRLLVLLVLAGFPIALVLAWAFDTTPHGIVRTDAAEGQPVLRRARRGTIAVGVLGVLIAVIAGIGYLAWHRPVAQPRKVAPDVAAVASTSVTAPPSLALTTTAPIPAKSVAVLPFVNESGDPSQQYFSDGLSEDLITALSQFAGLKVINRDSSFRFRNSRDDVKIIAAKLGVAHLLEGSVQRAGDEVRISAELVNAADGSTVWSQRYDKPYKDLFALQDAITQSVADALKAKLLTQTGAVVQSDRPPSGNLAAYNDFLQGKFHDLAGTEAGARQAIAQFNEATRLDPNYAAAYAAAASAWTGMGGTLLTKADDIRDAYAQAHRDVATALRLDPDLAVAHEARQGLMASVDFDWSGALAEAQRAMQLDPGSLDAKASLSNIQARLGHVQVAVELEQQVLTAAPLDGFGYFSLGRKLIGLGRLDEAQAALRKSISLAPGASRPYTYLALIGVMRGDASAALAAARQEPAGSIWHAAAAALALQIGSNRAAADAALKNLIEADSDSAAYQIAEVYALRRDPDNMFKWLEQSRVNRDAGIELMLFDPLILRYQHDPRFAAFCKKVGLPATTDAKALP